MSKQQGQGSWLCQIGTAISRGSVALGCLSMATACASAPTLADLSQETAALRQQVGALQLEIAVLKQEKAELAQAVNASVRQQNKLVEQYDLLVQSLKRDFAQLEQQQQRISQTQKEEIVQTLTQKLAQLVAKPGQTTAAGPPKRQATFSEDYPKDTGVVYQVVANDTLSSIASQHQATVSDIQNANRISDPRSLQVGQTLFIPQRK